jgi:FdrA protein
VVTPTLEGGAAATLAALGREAPEKSGSLRSALEAALARLGAERSVVSGLYSGGTLCYEALGLLGKLLGPVYSNIPLDKRYGLPAPEGAHVCLDLGEEEFTQGRPHPMIDPEARLALLEEAGARPDVAAILLDVVLGHGAHDDPAGTLAPACEAIAQDGGPVVVAYVLGTEGDPQALEAQRERLRRAGCIVAPTGARAALAAAALALRKPELVEALP